MTIEADADKAIIRWNSKKQYTIPPLGVDTSAPFDGGIFVLDFFYAYKL
jgi:hypothetical protein